MCHTIAFLLTTRSSRALKSYSTPSKKNIL